MTPLCPTTPLAATLCRRGNSAGMLVSTWRTRQQGRNPARSCHQPHSQSAWQKCSTGHYPLAHARGLLCHSRCLQSRLYQREHRCNGLCTQQCRDGCHPRPRQRKALLQHELRRPSPLVQAVEPRRLNLTPIHTTTCMPPCSFTKAYRLFYFASLGFPALAMDE